jgi:hypothetical protein
MANYLDPYAAELQGIQRQQKLAEMLMNQQQPQEQMVSGRVAPINPLQAFLPALNTYQGMNLQKNAEADTKKLADLVRGERQNELKDITNLMFGSENYNPAVRPEIQRDDMGNVMPNVQEQVGTAPNIRNAYSKALLSQFPEANALAPALYGQLTKQPDIKEVAAGGSLVGVKNGVATPLYTAPAKEEPKTEMHRNYNLAKEQGFSGSFMDYERYVSGLKHPNINIGMGGAGIQQGQGGFDKKGDFISPSGAVFTPTEVRKDREVLFGAEQLKKALNNINPQDVKATDTLLGDVSQGGTKGFIAKHILPKGGETLSAQNKINASGVMQILNNLPPGPASDKDIAQARSTFPGYGNAEALQKWIDNTNFMLDQKFNSYENKYGSMKWYGNSAPSQSKTNGVTGDFGGGNGFTIREKK